MAKKLTAPMIELLDLIHVSNGKPFAYRLGQKPTRKEFTTLRALAVRNLIVMIDYNEYEITDAGLKAAQEATQEQREAALARFQQLQTKYGETLVQNLDAEESPSVSAALSEPATDAGEGIPTTGDIQMDEWLKREWGKGEVPTWEEQVKALRAERDALLKECEELKAETQRLTTIGSALMVGLAHASPTIYEHMMKEIERSYPMKKSKASTND